MQNISTVKIESQKGDENINIDMDTKDIKYL